MINAICYEVFVKRWCEFRYTLKSPSKKIKNRKRKTVRNVNFKNLNLGSRCFYYQTFRAIFKRSVS